MPEGGEEAVVVEPVNPAQGCISIIESLAIVHNQVLDDFVAIVDQPIIGIRPAGMDRLFQSI